MAILRIYFIFYNTLFVFFMQDINPALSSSYYIFLFIFLINKRCSSITFFTISFFFCIHIKRSIWYIPSLNFSTIVRTEQNTWSHQLRIYQSLKSKQCIFFIYLRIMINFGLIPDKTSIFVIKGESQRNKRVLVFSNDCFFSAIFTFNYISFHIPIWLYSYIHYEKTVFNWSYLVKEKNL